MSAMAEKLQTAGVDTIGARLTTACIEAIRQHPHNVAEAWRCVGAAFGNEFILSLMRDMRRHGLEPNSSVLKSLENEAFKPLETVKPYQPRVIPPERLERRRETRIFVRSKYKNSGGIPWSDVSCHEAAAYMRDGKEAQALLAACPTDMANDGRTFGDVLGVKKTDEIIAQVRLIMK